MKFHAICIVICNYNIILENVNWKWFIIQLLIKLFEYLFCINYRLQQNCLVHQGICSLCNKVFEHLSSYLELVLFTIWCDQNFLQKSSFRPCLLRDYMYIKMTWNEPRNIPFYYPIPPYMYVSALLS